MFHEEWCLETGVITSRDRKRGDARVDDQRCILLRSRKDQVLWNFRSESENHEQKRSHEDVRGRNHRRHPDRVCPVWHHQRMFVSLHWGIERVVYEHSSNEELGVAEMSVLDRHVAHRTQLAPECPSSYNDETLFLMNRPRSFTSTTASRIVDEMKLAVGCSSFGLNDGALTS